MTTTAAPSPLSRLSEVAAQIREANGAPAPALAAEAARLRAQAATEQRPAGYPGAAHPRDMSIYY